jgi:hypothetical protein
MELPGWKPWTHKPQGLPPNAMLEQTLPTLQRLYHPMGEPLLFQTNEPVLLGAAEEAFSRFPLPVRGAHAPPLVLRLFVHGAGSVSLVQQERTAPHPVYRTQGHLFYVSLDAWNTAVADLAAGHAFGFVSPEVAHDEALVRFVFVECLALAMLATTRCFIPLHAGCVVRNGTGVALLGSSGSGKSTLTYACARRGYQILAEDGLMVKCEAEGMRFWGMPWTLHLLPDAVRIFAELAEEKARLQINGEWKLEVNPERYFPGSTTTSASLGPVLFLERGSRQGESKLEVVPRAEALEQLEIVWPYWVGWNHEMEVGVPKLLENGAFRLHMNGTPDQAVDALDRLFLDSSWLAK